MHTIIIIIREQKKEQQDKTMQKQIKYEEKLIKNKMK